jgi:hypothetical protein
MMSPLSGESQRGATAEILIFDIMRQRLMLTGSGR